MKKFICLLGMITCFLFCTISVRADAIVGSQDDFYENQVTIVVIALVAAVVLVTIALLVILKKRK